MVSVLFVDDDAAGLAALRTAYGRCREDWDTLFLPGPVAALDALTDRPVDAVVTSARLSTMSAATFLRLVKQSYPATARVALTEPGDRGAMLSTLAVVNQCLSKACGPEVLARVLERVTRLSARLYSPGTVAFVAEVGSLPSLPSSLAALDAALSDESCPLGRIADIVGADVAMAAKVLQLVNSSFFGLRAAVYDLRQAVAYLGVETLRDFAVAGAAFRAFTPSPLLSQSWMGTFNNHSLAVSEICGHMVRTSLARCEAAVAGMLHSVGELVLAERAPAKLRGVTADVLEGFAPDEAELRHLGTTLPVIGGHLLSNWGMGYHIVEAVTCQRETWEGAARDPELADIVAVSDRLAGSSRNTPDAGAALALPVVPVCLSATVALADQDYLPRVGLANAVAAWARTAEVGTHPAGAH